MADVSSWFPPDYPEDDRDALLAQYEDDPHRAAAEAWYDFAAQQDVSVTPAVTSVSTGVQTVTYKDSSGGVHQTAVERGDWHMRKSNAQSVQLGGDYAKIDAARIDVMRQFDDDDANAEFGFGPADGDLDERTIETVYYPPRP